MINNYDDCKLKLLFIAYYDYNINVDLTMMIIKTLMKMMT